MADREATGSISSPIVEAALAASVAEQNRRARLWRMTSAQRLAAYQRGELSFGDCLAWARRYPKEPPLAANGEWLFIAVGTPEWADAPERLPVNRKGHGREL